MAHKITALSVLSLTVQVRAGDKRFHQLAVVTGGF